MGKPQEQAKLRLIQASLDLQAGGKQDGRRYKINEIFYTLQGEGRNAGRAAIFIRFSNCNLSCSWCDTEYNSGVKMTAHAIREAVELLHQSAMKPIIVCTGGEPSAQMDEEFTTVFRDYPLTMETNGTIWKEAMRNFDTITVSPKTDWGWWRGWRDLQIPRVFMNSRVDLKVIYDLEEPLLEEIMRAAAETPALHHFLQPLENQETKDMNTQAVIARVQRDPRWRLSLQTHKLLGLR